VSGHAAGGRSRGYVLAILTAVYTVNFIDRQILPLLLQSIKREFAVSDSVLGLLAGPAFAFFYAIMGVPIALLADRFNRRKLIAVSLGLFSGMTLLCGLASRFWQLVLLRIGTGVGEAGTGPASQTIIADLYAGSDRARAQATYALGNNLGMLIAFACGGLIAQFYGWRAAFVLAGIPGLLLALILWFSLGDVPRRVSEQGGRAYSMLEAAGVLWRLPAFRWIALGASTTCFTGYAVVAFFPAFLERSHGMASSGIGLALALTVGVGGAAMTFLSGVLADRLGRRDIRWMVWVPAGFALIGIPLAPLALLADNKTIAILAAIPTLSVTAAFVGPIIVLVQQLVPSSMRATAVAMLILIDNVVGLGFGPQFVGLVSDALKPQLASDALRYAMLAAVAGYAVSALGFLGAARHLPRPGASAG